jgi:hypothetical protein
MLNPRSGNDREPRLIGPVGRPPESRRKRSPPPRRDLQRRRRRRGAAEIAGERRRRRNRGGRGRKGSRCLLARGWVVLPTSGEARRPGQFYKKHGNGRGTTRERPELVWSSQGPWVWFGWCRGNREEPEFFQPNLQESQICVEVFTAYRVDKCADC